MLTLWVLFSSLLDYTLRDLHLHSLLFFSDMVNDMCVSMLPVAFQMN